MKNSFKTEILTFIRSLGLPIAGIAGDGATYTRIVCLFPYYTGAHTGNISMYARAVDYHAVCTEYLTRIADFVQSLSPSSAVSIHVDKGEGDDRQAAFEAGLGFFGKNGLLIHETYGSFVFIGYVETDLVLSPDAPLTQKCIGCGKCEASCPGGAIGNGRIDTEKCASAISQKKGVLSEAETKILQKSGLAWGCDICQTVCPHNAGVPQTPLSVFRENLICTVTPFTMSNKAFAAQYGSRAFSWRGKAVLNRNLEILSLHEKKDGGHTE